MHSNDGCDLQSVTIFRFCCAYLENPTSQMNGGKRKKFEHRTLDSKSFSTLFWKKWRTNTSTNAKTDPSVDSSCVENVKLDWSRYTNFFPISADKSWKRHLTVLIDNWTFSSFPFRLFIKHTVCYFHRTYFKLRFSNTVGFPWECNMVTHSLVGLGRFHYPFLNFSPFGPDSLLSLRGFLNVASNSKNARSTYAC
jgi:hypothetical protein